MKISRRSVVGSSVAAAVFASSTIHAQESADATPSASGQFPVEVTHFYGTTTIPAAPTRVISLGWSTYDVLIALGIVPVAMTRQSWGGDEDGYYPWTRTAIGDRELPALLDTTDGMPFEDMILLEPDLILAPYSGITQDEYDRLSEIAPTVGYKEKPWSGSWQELTLTVGEAIGQPAEAEQLIADTTAYVESEAAAYPAIAGKSFLYGNMGSEGAFNIYASSDPRPLFLNSLGMVAADYQAELDAAAGDAYAVPVSYEQARELVADVVVFWFADEEEYATAQADPMFALIPAVPEERFAAIIGKSYVMATSAFSPLSIPYALEEFLPTINAAAENVEG